MEIIANIMVLQLTDTANSKYILIAILKSLQGNWMPTNYCIMEVMEYNRTSGGYTSWGG